MQENTLVYGDAAGSVHVMQWNYTDTLDSLSADLFERWDLHPLIAAVKHVRRHSTRFSCALCLEENQSLTVPALLSLGVLRDSRVSSAQVFLLGGRRVLSLCTQGVLRLWLTDGTELASLQLFGALPAGKHRTLLSCRTEVVTAAWS
jgi:hypothetical protein